MSQCARIPFLLHEAAVPIDRIGQVGMTRADAVDVPPVLADGLQAVCQLHLEAAVQDGYATRHQDDRIIVPIENAEGHFVYREAPVLQGKFHLFASV